MITTVTDYGTQPVLDRDVLIEEILSDLRVEAAQEVLSALHRDERRLAAVMEDYYGR